MQALQDLPLGFGSPHTTKPCRACESGRGRQGGELGGLEKCWPESRPSFCTMVGFIFLNHRAIHLSRPAWPMWPCHGDMATKAAHRQGRQPPLVCKMKREIGSIIVKWWLRLMGGCADRHLVDRLQYRPRWWQRHGRLSRQGTSSVGTPNLRGHDHSHPLGGR